MVGIDDYDLEEVRATWVGRVVATSVGRYPVEYDPIRRYCHMVRDANPLYLDPETAKQGPFGSVICPGPFIPFFAGQGPWPKRPSQAGDRPSFTFGIPTPGDRGINMNTAWEFLVPVRVGDSLRAEVRVADLFMKPIRLDPAAVWIVTETRISNQAGDVVAVCRNTVLVHRAPTTTATDE
jgi:acyl dehydratase